MGMRPAPRTGVLLVNLGTPASPSTGDVRRYLRQFLGDPRVLEMPAAARWLLLNLIILPSRPRRSAEAYRQIWSDAGSPLLVYSRRLARGVAEQLGDDFEVRLAMRYGEPAIEAGVAALVDAGVSRIVALPLFPQTASATTSSILAELHRVLGTRRDVPPLTTLGGFCDHPGFIAAQADLARPRLAEFGADHVLFSYHGLPESQVRRSDPTGRHCLASDDCCAVLGAHNAGCYRAQCYATTRALAAALGLGGTGYSTAFQSRLGRTPWIRPYTDVAFEQLAERGVKRLAVLCPSFVADCLETLEEIDLRGSAQWREQGGEELLLIPCANDDPTWVTAVATMVREAV